MGVKNSPITAITVHCSASSPDVYVDAKVIDRWHRQRGFAKIGYHYVIKRDGSVETGRTLDEVGAHVQNQNTGNIGVCLAGGTNKDGKSEENFTLDQYHSLAVLLAELLKKFPKAEIKGHRDWPGVKKDCPCFNVKRWWYETSINPDGLHGVTPV
jgi:N-acetylmuramoyl-L-alanine amidase